MILLSVAYLAMFAAIILAALTFIPSVPKPVLNHLFPLYRHAAISLMTKTDFVEYAFTYDKDGTVHEIESSHASHQTSVTIREGMTAGIVHTHPLEGDPRPSRHDIEVAKQTGLPDYVLSARELWVVYPNGKIKLLAYVEVQKNGLKFTKP
jgi:proteasome lid subunit RPN8/RPN11